MIIPNNVFLFYGNIYAGFVKNDTQSLDWYANPELNWLKQVACPKHIPQYSSIVKYDTQSLDWASVQIYDFLMKSTDSPYELVVGESYFNWCEHVYNIPVCMFTQYPNWVNKSC